MPKPPSSGKYKAKAGKAKAYSAEFEGRKKAIAGLDAKQREGEGSTRLGLDEDVTDEALPPENLSSFGFLPTTRAAAMRRGSSEYATGKPCIQGHRGNRETASGRCVACIAEGRAERAVMKAGKQATERDPQ
jgi:hypothetical protein